MPGKQRAEEKWVERILVAALPGALISQHDDGSAASMYDIDIDYADGRTAAVEVTSAAHPQALALWRLISEERWIERGLRGGWAVNVIPSTNYNSDGSLRADRGVRIAPRSVSAPRARV
jgi:hypothetical protein